MVLPTFTANGIRVNPGALYVAQLLTAEPVGLTGAWPSGWAPIGLTDSGHTDTYNTSEANIDAAELLDPVLIVTTGRTMTVAFSALNVTARLLILALNGGLVAPVTGTGFITVTPPDLGAEARVMMGWDATDGKERKIWRKCVQSGSIALARQKAPNKTVVPFSMSVEAPTDGSKPFVHLFADSLAA